jgi:hypothetical protein
MSPDGHLAHWTAAVSPHRHHGVPRLVVSAVLAAPTPLHYIGPDQPTLVWGVAANAVAPWREPAPGWHTDPPASKDIGRGAWGTAGRELGALTLNGSRLTVHRCVLDLPWEGALRTEHGIAFKWLLGDSWHGDLTGGGNLVVSAAYAALWHDGACAPSLRQPAGRAW